MNKLDIRDVSLSVKQLGANLWLLQPLLLVVEHEHVLHFQTYALQQFDEDEPVRLLLWDKPGQDDEGAAAAGDQWADHGREGAIGIGYGALLHT